MNEGLRIVPKLLEGDDPRTVRCTTYQMRNMYRQFGDGVANELDAHCYFQHAAAADLCPKNGRVLDVCCGRGLLIPMLRFRAKPQPSLYAGVDIHPRNAAWAKGADPRKSGVIREQGWGFPTVFVESDVAEMAAPIVEACGDQPFDLVVYTSAIEHMQIDAQQASLKQARQVAREGATLYLSCPLTAEGRDGYDTQYAAHVYEPKLSELRQWLDAAGWQPVQYVGLCTKATVFRKTLKGSKLRRAEGLYRVMPREQALTTIPVLYPECATELAIICKGVPWKL